MNCTVFAQIKCAQVTDCARLRAYSTRSAPLPSHLKLLIGRSCYETVRKNSNRAIVAAGRTTGVLRKAEPVKGPDEATRMAQLCQAAGHGKTARVGRTCGDHYR